MLFPSIKVEWKKVNVQRSMPNPSTRHPHHQPAGMHPRLPSPKSHLRRLVHELVKRRIHVVGKLNLRNGPHALERGANRKTNYPLLRQRRVEHPLRAKVRRETHTAAEDAAKGDIFAEEEHALVGLQGVAEGRVDALVEVQARRGAAAGTLREFGVREGGFRGMGQQRSGGVVDWEVQAGIWGVVGVGANGGILQSRRRLRWRFNKLKGSKEAPR